jgi:hypothetical protein
MASVKERRGTYEFMRGKLESGTHVVRAHERRDIARVRVDLPARVEWDGRVVDGLIVDLGIGGAFVRCSIAPAYGAYVHIAIEHANKPVHLTGIVRWGDERGFGTQFDRLGVYETSVVAGFIARARAKLPH